MLAIEKIDTENKSQVKRFVRFPHQLYKGCEQWVPLLDIDAYTYLNRKKHPFHEHSEVDFFLAVRDGEVEGRIAIIDNKPFNNYHNTKKANFYFFDSMNDLEVATALFDRVIEWAQKRNLTGIVGPKGMGPLDGYGILVFGHDHLNTMTMLNYNYPYYQELVEAQGFKKEVDFVSCFLPAGNFKTPERIERIANRAMARNNLQVKCFRNKKELLQWASRIGEAYNSSFVNNWEYFPLSPREIDFVVETIMMVADYRLIKIIVHHEDVVGFLFAFPDVSGALQRAKGKLHPVSLIDLLLEMKRTDRVSVNGVGILQEHQGHGGNAILYAEMGHTLFKFNQFEHIEMTQVAESAREMRSDLKNLNGVEYKNHRVYRKSI